MKIKGDPDKIGWVVSMLIRVVGWTLRFEIEDHARMTDPTFKEPLIWTFWHNRMFVVPLLQKWARHRTGAALTSGSRDGAIVAGVMKGFGFAAVRGSSSRRGAAAVRELTATLEKGDDVAISPDGPRGPKYNVSPGVVYLAQLTGKPIAPIHVTYSRSVQLKSWDGFMIPLPFGKVKMVCGELIYVGEGEDVEKVREKVEGVLRRGQGSSGGLRSMGAERGGH